MAQEGMQLRSDLVDLCSLGGFQPTKWVSNSRTVLSAIEEEQRGKNIRSLDLDKDKLPFDHALGLLWNVEDDTFRFTIILNEKPHTHRGILSMVSSVFDPLGILAPLTLPAKQFLLQLCKEGYGWNKTISTSQSRQWLSWIHDLPKLAAFSVPRCKKRSGFGKPQSFQLHHFADASELGYGTVSYIRMTNEQGNIHVSRVAPLKQLKIPRLQLAAAVLSVKVDKMLRSEVQLPLKNSLFWTGSPAVLKYIANDSARFHTYIANRVSFIREHTSTQQWRYVSSKDNLADDASRELSVPVFLESKRWICGSKFLWQPENSGPT